MRYWAFFCEENIWHLCADEGVVADGAVVPLQQRRVVFISNLERAVAMAHQRAGGGAVLRWDYHVVLLARHSGQTAVWDLDCDLGAPLAFDTWFEASFFPPRSTASERALVAGAQPAMFRVLEAALFLETFSSDRSHMLDARGAPLQPLPPWPAILRGASNLDALVDMRAPAGGAVLSLEEFARAYGVSSAARVADIGQSSREEEA